MQHGPRRRAPDENATRSRALAVRQRGQGRKRIAIVLPEAGALAKFGQGLIYQAHRRGHQICCLAPDWTETSARHAASLGAETKSLNILRGAASVLTGTLCLFRLRAAFKAFKPHVVLALSMKTGPVAALAGRLAGVARIVTMPLDCTDVFSAGVARNALRRLLLKPAAATAALASHAVILPCAGDASVLAGQSGARARKFIAAGLPGIDTQRIPHVALPALDQGLFFLMTADLDLREGVLDYCEAAEILRARSRSARCLLEGKAVSGRTAFPIELLKRYRSAVQYLGPRRDLIQLIARSHALVVPSHGMGRPDMLIVALALGRPIIATATRGLTEAVEDRVNGLVVPAGDPVALARAMMQFINRPDLIPRMANASRRLAEDRFDIRVVTRIVAETMRL